MGNLKNLKHTIQLVNSSGMMHNYKVLLGEILVCTFICKIPQKANVLVTTALTVMKRLRH